MLLFKREDCKSVEDYSKDFKPYWEIWEAYNAGIGFRPKLVDLDNSTEPETNKTIKEIQQESMAGLLISSANQMKLGRLKRELNNSYPKGVGKYSNTFEGAKRLS